MVHHTSLKLEINEIPTHTLYSLSGVKVSIVQHVIYLLANTNVIFVACLTGVEQYLLYVTTIPMSLSLIMSYTEHDKTFYSPMQCYYFIIISEYCTIHYTVCNFMMYCSVLAIVLCTS